MSCKNVKLSENVNNILSGKMEITEEIIKEIKKKRGRKSTKELLLLSKYNNQNTKDIQTQDVKVHKKRGRKPKGGKLIKPTDMHNMNAEETKPNIILHLRCNPEDITDKNIIFNKHFEYNPNIENIQPFDSFETNFSNNNKIYNVEVSASEYYKNNEKTSINEITTSKCETYNENMDTQTLVKEDTNVINIKDIWIKLKELQNKLKNNSICDKKSSCFWCTCDFDNPPVHIPKCVIDETYEVYGCFCMPECAAAYLLNEHIDTSIKWERYSMLNNLYSNVYNYTDNIKPSPNPHYVLDKFYGDLTIEEYRTLIRKGKQLLIINKPLTHTLPELVEDSVVDSKNSNKQYKLSRNKPSYNKLKTSSKSWAF